MTGRLREWFDPPSPSRPEQTAEERHLGTVEVWLVFGITLGMSALRSALSLVQSALRPGPLSDQSVALNAPAAVNQYIDMALQLTYALQLFGWGALGWYLLVRAGFTLRDIGLDLGQPARDALRAVGLALLIGIPGLALYLVSRQLGVNLTVKPSTLTETWWRAPVLIISAVGNAWAEEVLLTGYLVHRLRRLGWSENASAGVSALIRGCYHLYQGLGGAVGNLVMGLVFARFWQRTGRLWALVVAHALLDIVAFVGYSLLAGHVSWLP